MYKIYVAHPITGLTGKQVIDYYSDIMLRISDTITVLHPIIGEGELISGKCIKPTGYDDPLANDHTIFNRDDWMVSQSDIILCDLTGADRVSIGCVMEIALAHAYKKQVILVMEREGNPHEHSFIREAPTVIYDNLEDALKYVSALARSSFYI